MNATVRTRLLKSESDRERVYDVDLRDGTCAHDIEFLNDGEPVGAVRVLSNGDRIPIDADLPIVAPVALTDQIRHCPWWAYAAAGGLTVEALNLIGRSL